MSKDMEVQSPITVVERLISALLQVRAIDQEIRDLNNRRPSQWSYRDDNDLAGPGHYDERNAQLDFERKEIDAKIWGLDKFQREPLRAEVEKLMDVVAGWSLSTVLAEEAIKLGWIRMRESEKA